MSKNLTTQELAVLRRFSAFPSVFTVKPLYFTFEKNGVLKAAA
jgi:hypothetical protein